MAKIDKKFEYLCLGSGSNLWDFRDKEASTKDSVLYMLDRSSIMFKYHVCPKLFPLKNWNTFCKPGDLPSGAKSTAICMPFMVDWAGKVTCITVLLLQPFLSPI